MYEKHDTVGERARAFTSVEGYTFDLGPSWYSRLDLVNDHIFARYGRKVTEFYNLTLLDPAYRIELYGNETAEVPSTCAELLELVAQLGGENGSFALELFFAEAKQKFNKKIPLEVIDQALMRAGLELGMFAGFASHLWKYTAVPLMNLILKWPVIFIKAVPEHAASMYSLRTYAGHVQGTWCPDGGLSAPAQAVA